MPARALKKRRGVSPFLPPKIVGHCQEPRSTDHRACVRSGGSG